MKKAVLIPAILLAACLGAPIAAFAGKANDTLIYASDSEVDNVSPYHNSLREGVILSHMVWDTLLYRDPKTGAIKPELASDFKWESPTALVLDLRQGVTFHNGDKFSADDVVFTFSYALSPEAKIISRQSVDWIKSVDKLGDYKVRINLVAPFPAALEYLSGPTPIYPAAYFKRVGLDGFRKAPIGTGPYRITAVVPSQGVTMVRNAAYFKDSPLPRPMIGTIKFVVIPDQETRVAQLMTGAVDWIWRVPADQLEGMRGVPNISVLSGETMRFGYLTMDSRGTSGANDPMKDIRVRRAINHSVNRAGLASKVVRGGSQPTWAACFRTQFGCETKDVAKYDYNPAKAKALLAEAGYPKGFETDLYAYRDRDYAEAIVGDLRKVGIKARLHFLKAEAMQADYRAGKMPLSYQAWGSLSTNDASASVSVWFKGGVDDVAKDPQVIEWLKQADTSVDPALRKDLYAKALARISSQAYWAPMFTYSTNYAYTSDLNFHAYPDELPRFYEASWRK